MKHKILMIALAFFIGASLFGCGGGGGGGSDSPDPEEKDAPSLHSVTVDPDEATIRVGSAGLLFAAYAHYDDGSAVKLSPSSVRWTSDDESIAFVDENGLATAVSAGRTAISAVYGGETGTADLTVIPEAVTMPTLSSITVSPGVTTALPGSVRQFTATGHYNDGTSQILTNVHWSSSDSTVSVIDGNGLATALDNGETDIKAEIDGCFGTASLVVSPPASITVQPDKPYIEVSDEICFTAIGHFDGRPDEDLTHEVIWASSKETVAMVDFDGLAHGSGLNLDDGPDADFSIITATEPDSGIVGKTVLSVCTKGVAVYDNGAPNASFTGIWTDSPTEMGFWGTESLESTNGTYTWTFVPKVSGDYDVKLWWTDGSGRSANVSVEIVHDDSVSELSVNQTENGSSWNFLDRCPFTAGMSYTVTITAPEDGLYASADAVMFAIVDPTSPPTADFTSDSSSGFVSAIIRFFDMSISSIGGILSWLWDFGDGSTSAEQNPEHQYGIEGSYTVSLTVTDANGSDTRTKLNYISISNDMIFDNGSSGTSYTGTWSSSVASGSYGSNSLFARPQASYTWGFSSQPAGYYEVFLWWTWTDSRSTEVAVDINTAGGLERVYIDQTDASKSGKWNSLGTYYFNTQGSVTIHASSQVLPDGRAASTCADAAMFRFISGSEQPPTAAFSSDRRIGGIPCTVQFYDQSVGDVDEWLWDFGDGTTSTERNPSHIYDAVGYYTVSLTVTNEYGSNTLTQESCIHAVASVENIYICDGYDGAGPIFPSCVTELQALGATESNGVWRYDNDEKGVTYLIHHVTTPAGMEAALKEEGAHVIFKGHANYGMGATFAWTDLEQSWVRYFDDDLIVNLSTDMADPDIPGLKYGQAYPNWEPILQDGTSPIMPYTFDDPNGPPPYNYYLTYTVPGDPTHYRIEKPDGTYWERFPDSKRPAWYSPDGTPPDPVLNPEYFITNDSPDFNRCEFIGEWPMASPGDWHVSTTYVAYNYQYHNPGTGANKAIWTLVVDEPGLYVVIATWHAAPDHATNAPYTIHHAYGSETVRVDQRTTNYMNMLGYYYFDKGSHQIELSDDADGKVCADVVALSFIGNPASYINAEFSSSSRGETAPATINFRDYSTVYINGNFEPRYGWRWNFGDGTTSTVQNPSHTYQAPGVYTVSLTVIDELGNTDTETKEQYIIIGTSPTLRAEFTSNGQTTVPNTLIGFVDQSTGDIQSWLWDFGDGTTSTERNPYHAYAASGSYTVSLTVSGPDGSSTHTEENFICVTVGLAAADNTFYMKPHFYTVYSGALMGRTILDASEVTIPDEELRYSRLFYSSCTSGAYYLGKLHRGPTFYTTERTDGTNPIPGYLSRYLQGWSDEDLSNWVYTINPIYEFYNFDLLPPSMR